MQRRRLTTFMLACLSLLLLLPWPVLPADGQPLERLRLAYFSPSLEEFEPNPWAVPDPALSRQYYDDSWHSLRTFRLMDRQPRPILVYIESYPVETPLYKARYTGYVREGLDTWSQALDGRLRYVITRNPHHAQIRVTWVKTFAHPKQAGETIIRIQDAHIRIKTVGYPDNIIKANIMHELGHSLGIVGHSRGNSDIMNGARHWGTYEDYIYYQPQLTANDVRAIQRLYGPYWQEGEDLYAPMGAAILARTETHPPSKKRRIGWRWVIR